MIKIYNYDTIENAFGVWSNEQVYSIIVDEQYYYAKHKHKGILQTSLRNNQLLVAALTELEIDDYINENNLIDIKEPYNIWHEENMNIQLIFKLEKQAEFIIDNPDFAEKIKLAQLPVHIENGFVYIYANYLLDEDKEKLENPKYEIIINEKQ